MINKCTYFFGSKFSNFTQLILVTDFSFDGVRVLIMRSSYLGHVFSSTPRVCAYIIHSIFKWNGTSH
jgi:hypothetical protein